MDIIYYAIGAFGGAVGLGALTYGLQLCLGYYIGAWLRKQSDRLLRFFWPVTALQEAENLGKFVKENRKIAQQYCTATHVAESKILSKINDTKKKLYQTKKQNDFNKLNDQLISQERELSERQIVSELARKILEKIISLQNAVAEVIGRLETLFRKKPDLIKKEDLDFLLTTGKKSETFTAKIKDVIIKTEVASSARIALLEAKQKSTVKEGESDPAIVLAEEKLTAANADVSISLNSVKELISSSLQLELFANLFEKPAEADIENGGSIELTGVGSTVLDGSNLSSLINMEQYYETNSEQYGEHLPTIRRLAKDCKSTLEFSNGSMALLWASLVGLVEGKVGDDKPVYRGYFPVLHHDGKIESAQELADRNSIDFQLLGDRLKIESQLDATVLGNFDMLIINTWNTYCQYKYDLDKYSSLINKYIVLTITKRHDDSDSDLYNREPNNGDYSEYPTALVQSRGNKRGLVPAIQDFLAEHPEWKISMVYNNGFGITVLEKVVA